MTKKSINSIKSMKGKELISMITAYDAVFSEFASISGIDLILVGDSVANTMLGYKNTKLISMNEMIHHVKAVARAKPVIPIVADMPKGSYSTPKKALRNAKLFLNAGANAVKLEGVKYHKAIRTLRKHGIEVMGHIGLLPQTAKKYCVQGKKPSESKKLINDAVVLDSMNCFSIVMECIPSNLAEEITSIISCPTIGIGAGPKCDGQVLVVNDLIGLHAKSFKPKFVKRYIDLAPQIIHALNKFSLEVKQGKFPSKKESYE
jgi:3-methyl-2-oxobutanoate hydroxymethyltransferase